MTTLDEIRAETGVDCVVGTIMLTEQEYHSAKDPTELAFLLQMKAVNAVASLFAVAVERWNPELSGVIR